MVQSITWMTTIIFDATTTTIHPFTIPLVPFDGIEGVDPVLNVVWEVQ
jgi:hypothetical protein